MICCSFPASQENCLSTTSISAQAPCRSAPRSRLVAHRFEQALSIGGFERIDVEIVREVHERVAGVRPLKGRVVLLSQADHKPCPRLDLRGVRSAGSTAGFASVRRAWMVASSTMTLMRGSAVVLDDRGPSPRATTPPSALEGVAFVPRGARTTVVHNRPQGSCGRVPPTGAPK